jgi:hypothetical protein
MTDTDWVTIDPWPVRWSCDDVNTASPTATGLAVQWATATLWALSGRQFGFSTVTLRPCRDEARDTPFPDAWLSWPGTQMPPLGATSSGGLYGYYVPALCGSCQQGCSCATLSQIKLPAPVHAVTQVKVDGIVLTGSAYRVDDNRYLVRTDGFLWPMRNNVAIADTQLGTWSVTAQYGSPVPAGAEVAIGELACQFLNGEDCTLPRQVTQLVRQGVAIQMPDPTADYKNGLTGLYTPDLFITIWNPGRLRQRARTYSVDSMPARRVGT